MIKVFCALKNIMDERNLNIKEVQEKTKLSRTTIGNLIHHRTAGIQFETLSVLCTELNCRVSDLIVDHDILLKFRMNREEFTIISEYEMDSEGDTRKEVLVDFDINSTLVLDSNDYEVNFKLESVFSYSNEYLDIEEYVTSILFNKFISESNFPYYIQNYIEKELNEFFYEQINDFLTNDD